MIARDRLPTITGEVLASVQQHRLLHTAQIHAMHTPHATMRWTQRLLAHLGDHGLLAAGRTGGRRRHWYLTSAGQELVQEIPGRVETRPKLLTAAQADGALTAHTLAVSDVGITYLQAAREREDDFGPFSWRHEVAHPIGAAPGGRQQQQLIADALISYLRFDSGRLHQHQRFLELDRASMPTEALIAKLHNYQRLRTYTPPARRGQPAEQPAWMSSYRVLPQVQIVLAGKPRPALHHRLQVLLALYAADPALRGDRELKVSICLLEDLQTQGPFAPVWRRAEDPAEPVDWLGQPERGRSA